MLKKGKGRGRAGSSASITIIALLADVASSEGRICLPVSRLSHYSARGHTL